MSHVPKKRQPTGLKAEIDKVKAEHEAAEAAKRQDQAEKDARERRREEAEAEQIMDALPSMVRAALNSGYKNVILYRGPGLPSKNLNELTNTPAALVRLLREEGLIDRVWVDIDCSGSLRSENALMFTV